jgi:uncharacterized protein (UPF0264 family)
MRHFDFISNGPGLLISVRNAEEARIALAGGADVIDVKEPSRGSLGAADAQVVAEVVAVVGGRVPVSVAGGELLERAANHESLIGVSYTKVGLAGCRPVADWHSQWRAAISRRPAHVAPVAVVYVDWRRATAPPPDEVLSVAVQMGCPALLVDTCDKSAGGLFDHWPPSEVASFCRHARKRGLAVVLAGSLQVSNLETAVRCKPGLIAVRGAVCDHGRCGSVSSARVRAVRLALTRLARQVVAPGAGTSERGEVASKRR